MSTACQAANGRRQCTDAAAIRKMKQTGGGQRMSKVIEFTDEQYRTLAQAAAARGQTLDALLAELIEELGGRDRDPRYYETDDWFRHLGATEGQIAEAKRIAHARSGAGHAHPSGTN